MSEVPRYLGGMGVHVHEVPKVAPASWDICVPRCEYLGAKGT